MSEQVRAKDTEELERGSLVWQRRGFCLDWTGSHFV